MRILTNKSGIGLSAVLAIIFFVISSTVIVITTVYGTSLLIEADYKASQEYINSQNRIDVTAKIIIRDEDLSQAYISDLSDYMGVTISDYGDGIYSISDELSKGQIVSSYIAEATTGISIVNMGDDIFSGTGIESSYEHNVLLEPATILSSYLDNFMPATFSSLGYNESFSDFDSIFDYFADLANEGNTYIEVKDKVLEDMKKPVVGGHWFVTGDLKIDDNKDLIIPDGYVLFIDGNLEMGTRSLLSGIVVVNGKVKLDTNSTYGELEATVYCSGKFVADKTLYLGTSSRPSFVFADGLIDLKKNVYGYGYFYSADGFEVNKNNTNIEIIGGVYAPSVKNLSASEIDGGGSFDSEDLYDMGVSNNISIIDESNNNTGFVYTYPK
ncbi:MAG: hypothetical protein JEZ05_00080 [Tenericutes bacterium]|nr:hypothetical protein [Mycoplasmatota bacterium]